MEPNVAESIYVRFSGSFAANKVSPDILIGESTETVRNRRGSFRGLRSTMRHLPLRPTLQLLGSIAVEIERGRHPLDAALQVRVARLLAHDRRSHALARRLFANPGTVLVDSEQIAMLSAYAIAFCEAETWPLDGYARLLEALLTYHSVKGQELQRAGDIYESLLRTEVRSVSTDSEAILDVMARWRAFARWAETGEATRSYSYVNINALFQEKLGLGIVAWTAATWTMVAHFAQIKMSPEGPSYDAFLDPTIYYSTLTDRSELVQWLEQTSISLEDARRALREIKTTSLSEIELLMNTPLVRTPWGICCPVLRFLPNVAGNGLMFRLGSHLAIEESNRLRQFFGQFLEYHLHAIIRDVSRDRDVKIFSEQRYGRSEKKSSDLALFDGDSAVFIDVTSTRFNLRESVVSLEPTNVARDMRRFVTDKVSKEISRCAREFWNHELVYDGINSREIKRIYGLVVSPQGLTRLLGIAKLIDEQVPAVPTGLQEWDYFDLNEIESLPKLFKGNLNLPQLIADKRSDVFGRSRSLASYLYFRKRQLVDAEPTHKAILDDPWFLEIIACTKRWGLGAPVN